MRHNLTQLNGSYLQHNMHLIKDSPIYEVANLIKESLPGYTIVEDVTEISLLVGEYENFDFLLVPKTHSCRGKCYSTIGERVLRTHLAALFRKYLAQGLQRVLCIGPVFRVGNDDKKQVNYHAELYSLSPNPQLDLDTLSSLLFNKLLPQRTVFESACRISFLNNAKRYLVNDVDLIAGGGCLKTEISKSFGHDSIFCFSLHLDNIAKARKKNGVKAVKSTNILQKTLQVSEDIDSVSEQLRNFFPACSIVVSLKNRESNKLVLDVLIINNGTDFDLENYYDRFLDDISEK